MTPLELYPPIAVATVVGVTWFAIAHRLNKRDTPGQESWTLILWLLSAPALLGWYFFTHAKHPVIGYFDIFMTALSGLAVGAIIVFSGHRAIFAQGISRNARAYLVAQTVAAMLLFTILPNL